MDNHREHEVTMVSASDVLRTVQRAQEMQRQLHTQILLASLEHCPVEKHDTKLRELWQKFKPTDQDDGEVVYKFLSRCGSDHDSLFRGSPWQKQVLPNWPTKFHADPKALLAFLSNDRCRPRGYYNIPRCFEDNKEVMIAICSKYPDAFWHASLRLRDDEEFVWTALQASSRLRDNKERRAIRGWDCLVIGHVSQRLLKDKKFFFDTVRLGYCTPLFTRAWVAALDIESMDIKEQTEIGHVISRSLRHYEPCKLDFRFLSKFSQELRDDATFMLSFVKLDWRALEYCSERLRSSTDVVRVAVSKNINAYQYVMGPVLQQYNRKRPVDAVLHELDQGLSFENVPKKLKTNKGVILAAMKAGKCFQPLDFPEDLWNDKTFILDVIAAHSENVAEDFYTQLPEHLQLDEDVAKALIEAGYPDRVEILGQVPSLLTSRDAMMTAVKFSADHYHHYFERDGLSFSDLIARCPFHIRDDEEFMLKAFKSNHDAFEHASERLRSNRDFVTAALVWSHRHTRGRHNRRRYSFITHTTDEFQVQNLDLIIEAFERSKSRDEWENDDEDESDEMWFSRFNEAVWSNKAVVMACVRKGWALADEIPIGPNSPLLDDKELVFLSIKSCPSNLIITSPALQQDRKFILELVTEIDSVLEHAPEYLKYDKEILLTAVARSGGAICHCFDCFKIDKDFEFLCNFALEIRSEIATHKSFNEFLRGIVAPSCRLSMLNQGSETDVALKKKIAEFAGIRLPMGSRLQQLVAAISNMEKFGF